MPLRFRSSPMGPYSVRLSWTDTANETSYYLNGHQANVTLSANTTSFVVDDLAANADYYYEITARNTAGDSAKAGPIAGTTAIGERGAHAIESYNTPGYYMFVDGSLGELRQVVSELETLFATMNIGNGFVLHSSCLSLRSTSTNGFYLLNVGGRVAVGNSDGSDDFSLSATFCQRQGLADKAAVSFEAWTQPGLFIRHRDHHLYVESGSDEAFRQDATWRYRDTPGISIPPCPSPDPDDNRPLSYSQTLSGRICPENDKDIYYFGVDPGDKFRIRMVAQSPLSPWLHLMSADQTTEYQGTGSGPGGTAEIVYTATSTIHDYKVWAVSAGNATSGDYTIVIERVGFVRMLPDPVDHAMNILKWRRGTWLGHGWLQYLDHSRVRIPDGGEF